MADRLEQVEKARVAEQKAKLGPEGLAECERVLEEAKKEHEQEIPKEILTSFPVPSVKSISWIPVQSYQESVKGKERAPAGQQGNAELAKHIESDGTPLPFFVQYDHVKVRSYLTAPFSSRRTLTPIIVRFCHGPRVLFFVETSRPPASVSNGMCGCQRRSAHRSSGTCPRTSPRSSLSR